MATEQQIERTVTIGMSIVARYHDVARTARTAGMLVCEVQLLASWVNDLGIGWPEADESILRPLECRLLARYGHELGARLNAEFAEAFDGPGAIREAATAVPVHRGR